MNRGYGWRPDPEGHRVTSARHLIGEPDVPAGIDLRDTFTILDQGSTNSCVGHAIVAGIASAIPQLPRLSPVSPYDWARCIDAPPDADLFDLGCEPNQAVRGIAEWGVARWEDRPTDPKTINQRPPLGELESASGFVFRGAYRIAGGHSAVVDQICGALYRDIRVVVAFTADDAFEQYRGGLYVPGGRANGGHMCCLAGFETRANGSVVFYLANSWNTAWGERGFALMPESVVDGWRDMFALAVEPS